MTETILANATLVLPHEVIHGAIRIEDGAITAIDQGVAVPTGAVDCGGDGAFARAVLAGLDRAGVFARMPAVAPMDRCIRLSCGPADQLDAFAAILPEALAAARAR